MLYLTLTADSNTVNKTGESLELMSALLETSYLQCEKTSPQLRDLEKLKYVNMHYSSTKL